eukprot:TRINITY_DN12597_c1_g1_i1.p1 TRINITY_DN12597_c1_g1~~TRINITY_DN12597_c1_g1_i1.p1  ORF type:complete len:295 (+),score=11.06 TRINITY_DN12597_c1_g1_i1:475-1359(+)
MAFNGIDNTANICHISATIQLLRSLQLFEEEKHPESCACRVGRIISDPHFDSKLAGEQLEEFKAEQHSLGRLSSAADYECADETLQALAATCVHVFRESSLSKICFRRICFDCCKTILTGPEEYITVKLPGLDGDSPLEELIATEIQPKVSLQRCRGCKDLDKKQSEQLEDFTSSGSVIINDRPSVEKQIIRFGTIAIFQIMRVQFKQGKRVLAKGHVSCPHEITLHDLNGREVKYIRTGGVFTFKEKGITSHYVAMANGYFYDDDKRATTSTNCWDDHTYLVNLVAYKKCRST